jgi:DNA polymerase III epsilon subunit-like protein
MNNCNIACFDFETGGLDTNTCPVIQVAATIVNPRTLEPIPNATFSSMMCPSDEDFQLIQDGALAVNKKTREEIKAAPIEGLVWKQFCEFIQRYRTSDGLPIPAGKNIRGFDLPIAERLCKKHGFWDKKHNRNNIWHWRYVIELEDFLFYWFEDSNELSSYSMDNIRPYFGITSEGAHDALVDVQQTVKLITKFMRLHRAIAKRTKFRDSCKE